MRGKEKTFFSREEKPNVGLGFPFPRAPILFQKSGAPIGTPQNQDIYNNFSALLLFGTVHLGNKAALILTEEILCRLDHIDRNIMLTMIQKFKGGPVGLDTLAAAIGEDAGTIEDVYEPYLIKSGLINRTPRGRMVTEAAYSHFGLEISI